jgi:hypothetical protein
MFAAGSDPGLSLLPAGWDTDAENEQDGAQIGNGSLRDGVVDITWYAEGEGAGNEGKNVTAYFQDGALLEYPSEKALGALEANGTARVLARYESTEDVAVAVLKYGQGWLGLSGVHLEADPTWCEYFPEVLMLCEGVVC